MTPDLIPPLLSVAALLVSCVTAWLTLFRRGTLKMTRPAVVYFGADGQLKVGEQPKPKVFVRALLYSTGKRGCVIESMHATVRRGETTQTFSVWVYGDKELTRGSGLFVGETGFATNHHFLLPGDGTDFRFLAGSYQVDVYATLVGQSRPHKLCTVQLPVPAEVASALATPTAGAYFDWGPESNSYSIHIKKVEYKHEGRTVLVPGA
jgi:hypothetical protein